jgi:hypothetical protein
MYDQASAIYTNVLTDSENHKRGSCALCDGLWFQELLIHPDFRLSFEREKDDFAKASASPYAQSFCPGHTHSGPTQLLMGSISLDFWQRSCMNAHFTSVSSHCKLCKWFDWYYNRIRNKTHVEQEPMGYHERSKKAEFGAQAVLLEFPYCFEPPHPDHSGACWVNLLVGEDAGPK